MTDQERKAMEMALEALEEYGWYQDPVLHLLRQALAQPEQKPVAFVTRRTGDGGVVLSGYETCESTDYDAIPVYTATASKPQDVDVGIDVTELGTHIVVRRGNEVIKSEFYHAPKREWVSLTKEEIDAAIGNADYIYLRTCEDTPYEVFLTRAIEAALKEKNNG